MRKSDLLRHNVSHLVVFQSLMQTLNVTATATALHMSQPAVSRALTHLRDMFGDPLFVRAPGGVAPTDRAKQLAPRASELVDELAELIAPEEFDLASSERTFRIATTDYGASTVLSDICETFCRKAPKASLEIVPFASDAFRDLSEGRLDLVFYADAAIPDSLLTEFLFQESYSCLCRKGHPVVKQQVDGIIPMEAFLAWPHAMVTVFGGRFGMIDGALKERGLQRHIALRLPYFSTAPVIVAQSDLLLTLPSRTAEHFARMAKLQRLKAPLEISSFDYRQVWHPRTDLDPAAVWLRQLIKERSGSNEPLGVD